MAEFPDRADLIRRAKAIRLPLRRLAAEAGLNDHTVGRMARRTDRVEARTVKEVDRVINSHERQLLMQLVDRQREWLREQFPKGMTFERCGLPGQKALPL